MTLAAGQADPEMSPNPGTDGLGQREVIGSHGRITHHQVQFYGNTKISGPDARVRHRMVTMMALSHYIPSTTSPYSGR